MTSKNCTTCNTILSGRQRKFCSNKCKAQYSNNKFQNYEAQKNRALNRKILFVISKGGRCETCGYNKNLAALVFHHIDPNLKKFKLDARSLSNRTEKSLMEEIDKCQLLCSNCHMELHHPTWKIVPGMKTTSFSFVDHIKVHNVY